jgi:HAMP domain-containing protein
MGHACTHDDYPGGPDGHEHPVVAVLAILAIAAAILLILWVRVELHGTDDIEAAFTEPDTEAAAMLKPTPLPREEREVEEAATSSRFATGFSH